MNNYDLIAGLISVIALIAFFILCINVNQIRKNQKKSNFLLRKIFEQNGGKLLQYEIDDLEE